MTLGSVHKSAGRPQGTGTFWGGVRVTKCRVSGGVGLRPYICTHGSARPPPPNQCSRPSAASGLRHDLPELQGRNGRGFGAEGEVW